MDQPRRVAVFLNPSSGFDRAGPSPSYVEEILRAVGLEPEMIPLHAHRDVPALVAAKVQAGFDTLVAAGGDGTIGTLGAALAGTDAALGVLPAGTFNHFAKDLRIPLHLPDAARVIAAGHTARVDVAEVNGHVFLNNSSTGLYPSMVSLRENYIKRGVPKRLAMVAAALIGLWRFPNTTVRLTTDQTGLVTRTPFVFVGNNAYEFAGWEAGTRAHLRAGVMQIVTVADPRRSALLRVLFFAFIGRVHLAPQLRTMTAQRARIDTFRRRVKVALDGEVVKMRSPLLYSIRPAALNVIVPGDD